MIIMAAPLTESKDKDKKLDEHVIDQVETQTHGPHVATHPTGGLQLGEGQFLVDPDYYWWSSECESFEDLIMSLDDIAKIKPIK